MPSAVGRLTQNGLLHPPKWLPANIHYETMMGSVAYGVSSDTSDMDVYGFAIPPKELVFPHLAGHIDGFGRQKLSYEQYQQHHVLEPDSGKEWDFSIYSIVKYFQLCMENNPNMIDSLFTPRRCVLYSTEIGEMVRDRRKMFLHKGAWHKFKGYAYSQFHKIGKANKSNPKRAESIEKYGYDVKFAYHVVRLISEVEQIMVEHDLDITRNREQLKAIRRGEWTLDYLKTWFEEKEKALETVYAESTLQHSPDEEPIKQLLMDCLEHHYGDLSSAVARDASISQVISEMKLVIDRYDH